LALLIGTFALAGYAIQREPTQNAIASARPASLTRISAPGRIEGASETIQVGTSGAGLVEKVMVKEGETVEEGQVLARLDCREQEADLRQRVAELEAARAVFERLKNGPRHEDIEMAQAELRVAEARVVEADESHRRSKSLQQHSVASMAQLYVAERDASVAAAQSEAARQRLAMLRAGTRPEELAEASAKLEAAAAAIESAKERVRKCDIRSPVNGIVLKKFVSAGELMSQFAPRPLFAVSETGRTRVRAEVDERDLVELRLGEPVKVLIHGRLGRQMAGRLVEIGRSMGRRQVLTGDPAEKSDRDVLEAVVDLEGVDLALPLGLRVSVIMETDPRENRSIAATN
jgi:HlyD family secretion protein